MPAKRSSRDRGRDSSPPPWILFSDRDHAKLHNTCTLLNTIHDSQEHVIHDSQKHVIHDSQKHVIHNSQKHVIHDSQKPPGWSWPIVMYIFSSMYQWGYQTAMLLLINTPHDYHVNKLSSSLCFQLGPPPAECKSMSGWILPTGAKCHFQLVSYYLEQESRCCHLAVVHIALVSSRIPPWEVCVVFSFRILLSSVFWDLPNENDILTGTWIPRKLNALMLRLTTLKKKRIFYIDSSTVVIVPACVLSSYGLR